MQAAAISSRNLIDSQMLILGPWRFPVQRVVRQRTASIALVRWR